jgi:ketosteroid isomerase-like protein
MRSILCAFVMLVGVVFASQSPIAIPKDATARILRMHELDREAHLRGDAEDIASRLSDRIVVVSEGNITTESKEKMHERFVTTFRRTKHSAWEDVETPVVRVSQDGTMAWGVFNVRSRYLETAADGKQKSVDVIMSWLCTYEIREGHWLMTGVATTYPTEEK